MAVYRKLEQPARLLEPIGDIPPAEFEAMYYARHESPATGVGLN
jgi:hypothetical protein